MNALRVLLVRDWGMIEVPASLRFDAAKSAGGASPSSRDRDQGDADSRVPISILLIEDDHALAQMYRRRLEHAGHKVDVAADGEAGLRQVRRQPYDLVFLDIGLPKIDGLAVLEAIRSDDAYRDLPVVMLTNYNEPDLIERSRQLGIVEFLVKAETTPGQVADRVREFREASGT
jgi:CheY-like chemotaxis protein